MQPYYNFIVPTLYTILYYVLVPICVQSIFIIFLLRQKHSASLQHQRNWCQPPLPTARRPSISNGGAPPVPVPTVALPFWRVLTSVSPVPVPPTPHPFHPSHPSSNHPVYPVRPGAGQTASRGLRRCKYFHKANTPLSTMFLPHLNTISAATVSSITLTFNPIKNPGMVDPTSPSAPLYLPPPPLPRATF